MEENFDLGLWGGMVMIVSASLVTSLGGELLNWKMGMGNPEFRSTLTELLTSGETYEREKAKYLASSAAAGGSAAVGGSVAAVGGSVAGSSVKTSVELSKSEERKLRRLKVLESNSTRLSVEFNKKRLKNSFFIFFLNLFFYLFFYNLFKHFRHHLFLPGGNINWTPLNRLKLLILQRGLEQPLNHNHISNFSAYIFTNYLTNTFAKLIIEQPPPQTTSLLEDLLADSNAETRKPETRKTK